ncbi:MAG: DUF1345 domain-containing protein [Rhodomicrobium sp.]
MASARSWYNPMAFMQSVMIRPRFFGAAIVGLLGVALLPHSWPHTVRSPVAWDMAGLVYLFFALRMMSGCGADRIKARAGRRDDSRAAILFIILLAIAASFAAIAGLIGEAKLPTTGQSEKLLLAGLAVVTIMTSWGVTQVAFALHYAHDFYRPDDGDEAGGLLFPECEDPDYWDFLYFATSIGATSQTSDTAIRSRALRRLVTVHAIVAFFFNTAVLALTVNIAASLAG